MSISSHAVVGAVIVAAIDRPELSLPLAFLSHFVLDAIPHFGYPGHDGLGYALQNRLAWWVAAVNLLLLGGLLFVLVHFSAGIYIYIGALLAAVPDFEWGAAYFFFERHGKKPWRSPIAKFHEIIQWYEEPGALVVDLIFALLGFWALARLLG